MDFALTPRALSELSAALLQAAILLGLAVACAVLYRRTSKPWFAWWTLAWLLYAVRMVAIMLFLGTTDAIWLYWHQVVTGWVGLGLLWAALVFSRGAPLTGRWYLWALFPPVWAYVAIYQMDSFLLAAGPAVAFLSVATLWTAGVFWRHARQVRSGAARFLATALLLWGVHHLDYPFLRARGAWDPWGYYLDILFVLAVGGGIFLLVIEDQRGGLRVLSAVTGALQRSGADEQVLGGLLAGIVAFPAVRGAAYWDGTRDDISDAAGTLLPLVGATPPPDMMMLLEAVRQTGQPAVRRHQGYVAALPVRDADAFRGALLITGDARDPFAALDLTFLSALGRQVAAALEHAALDRGLRERTDDLERLAQRVLRLHEEERRRLSRELHDETAQLLSALKMELGVLRERTTPGGDDSTRLDRAVELVNTGIRSIRHVTESLRPALLDDLGLLPALRALTSEFRQTDGLDVALALPDGLPDLSAEGEVAVFRAVQEGLSNVVRHAAASAVSVTVEQRDTGVVVHVTDNGTGLDAAAPIADRTGIAGMRERIGALGGAIQLRAGAAGGTELEVIVPVRADP